MHCMYFFCPFSQQDDDVYTIYFNSFNEFTLTGPVFSLIVFNFQSNNVNIE